MDADQFTANLMYSTVFTDKIIYPVSLSYVDNPWFKFLHIYQDK